MNEPDLFDALRAAGIDADRAEIRAAVRMLVEHIEMLRADSDPYVARACMEAMNVALRHLLSHPEVTDMSSFENDFGGGSDQEA